jgi:Ca2+-binding RTX toxin-like protein
MARIDGTNRSETLEGGAQGDVIYGNGGNDVLWGLGGRDQLYGGAGVDVLRGGDGDDRLQGGPGNDIYIGGDGSDRFVFTDVPASGSTTETVSIYQIGDILDFSDIDANWNRDGNQAFRYLGETDFDGRPGAMVIGHYGEGLNKYTQLFADVDGNGQADMTVRLNNGWFDFVFNGDLIL